MANQNDVVIVDLDRPRELRFGHKALKKIGASLNASVEELEGGQEFDENELELIYFYGLQKDAKEHGENLTLEMMEDILDHAPAPVYQYLMQKINEALTIAMGGAAGNVPEVEILPPAKRAAANQRK